jgi:uncharacterized protein YukE
MATVTTLGVDTERLAATVPEFRQIANSLEQVRTTLEGQLGALDKCWGQDDTGKSFEDNYLEPAQNLRDGLKTLVEVLGSVADGINTMTRGADRTEQDALDTARSAVRLPTSTSGSPSPRVGLAVAPVADQISTMRDVLGGAQP